MSCYSTGYGAGVNSAMANPWTYCAVSQLDSAFNHPSTGGAKLCSPYSYQCQAFTASSCANKWTGLCEMLSKDQNRNYPNQVVQCNGPFPGHCQSIHTGNSLTAGEILITNTASEKYLVAMSDNCRRMYEPFDPTVRDSPLISKWVPVGDSCASGSCGSEGGVCVPIYDVDAKTIDKDPVMNHILDKLHTKPSLWLTGLVNIYNNRLKKGTLNELRGTRLWNMVYSQKWFQTVLKKGVGSC